MFENYFILEENRAFIVLRYEQIRAPSDFWLIEATYVDEFDSYEEALAHIEKELRQ